MLNCCDEIDRYVKTHLKILNIDFYAYTKSYANNKRITLSNDPIFLALYFQEEHYKLDWVGCPSALKHYAGSVITWQFCHENHRTCKLWQSHQQAKNIRLYLWLHFQYESYSTAHFFGISDAYQRMFQEAADRELTMLLNDANLLKRFIQSFTADHQDMLIAAEKHKYHVDKILNQDIEAEFQAYWGEYFESIHAFKEVNKPDKIYLSGMFDGVYLTRHEAEMLYKFYYGKSYKDLAQEYQLSVRTIEQRFSVIKDKLSAKSKLSLFKIVDENDVIEIIKVCL